jgi:hypothetical protein
MVIKNNNQNLLSSKIDNLCENFETYVNNATKVGRLDSPARYFHLKTLERLNYLGLEAIFDDELYFEYLFATLTSWGMDNRGAKMVGFSQFVQNIRIQEKEILDLNKYTMDFLLDNESEFTRISDSIYGAIYALGISMGKSQLVCGSKVLHHLLPNLVPPIDREYTLNFFLERKNIYDGEEDFAQVFIDYSYIYDLTQMDIKRLMNASPLNSSLTKVIDNAIIGYQAKGKHTMWTT